jgi:hypothetical protein
MVTSRQIAHAASPGRAIVRWARGVVMLPGLFVLPATGVSGIPAGAQAGPAPRVLESSLARLPEDPRILEHLAGVRLGQGRLLEAEALATRLVRVQPAGPEGWLLLAAIRYLQDDTRGALEAWSRGRPLNVGDVEIRVVPHRGTSRGKSPDGIAPDPARFTGIVPGEPLTVERLVRGERRLRSLPAAARTRLGYRALPGGQAEVEGAIVLAGRNPFGRSEWLGHGLRLLVGRVHLASADPLGRMERWELNGGIEGSLRSGTLTLAHPAPRTEGVWRWDLQHRVGQYGVAGQGPGDHATDGDTRETRTTLGWTHTQWLVATFRGRIQGRVDRTERGTFAGASLGGTLLPLHERGSIDAEGSGWIRMGGGTASAGEPRGAAPFGRLAIRASLHPVLPPLMGAPSGWAVRGGVVAVSSDLPPDLRPRIGSGGRTELLMRARSDLDPAGVVRPLYPGRAWLHGGIEYLRPLRSIGGVGIGVGAFADGVRVVASEPGVDRPRGPRGAIHLGAGLRARVPGVDGWLRVDWGVDPSDGASRLSAAWVHELPG